MRGSGMQRWVCVALCSASVLVWLSTSERSGYAEPPGAEEKASDVKVSVPEGYVEHACEDAPEGMSCIKGGPFMRGVDKKDKNARPAEKIWLTTFYMDQYEVTNKEYKACVKAGKCQEAGPRYRGYHGDKQPITGVSWYDAVTYCKAMGKHLPTEAQWEKAARGDAGELNPWGDSDATCKEAVIMDDRGRACGVKKPGSKPEAGRIFDVGSKPAWRYGLYDMVGNAEEWVFDWYSDDFESCGAACKGVDPKGPCDGETTCKGHRKRVLKGGSWYWPASHGTGFHRRSNVPSNKPYHHFGFRCAASVDEAKALVK